MKEYRNIPIQEIENRYIIDRSGYLIDKKSQNIIYGTKDKYGYLVIFIKELNARYLMHRIIATKFLPVDNMTTLQVNHKDLNKENNCIDNLEWVTNIENIQHSRANQKYKQYIANKLSSEQVINIYKSLLKGMSTKQLSIDYNVSECTITNIKYKRTYQLLLAEFPDIPTKTSSTKLSDEQIEFIKSKLESGYKPSEISKQCGIPRTVIIDYKRGRTFTNNKVESEKFVGGEKLRKEQVLDIIKLYKSGKDIRELAQLFNVCPSSIKNIINKKTWKNLTKNIDI